MLRSMLVLLVLWLLPGQAESFVMTEPSTIRYAAEVIDDHSWQGQAPLHRMTLVFDPSDVTASLELSITVMARDFQSGNWLRDQNGRRAVFEVNQFPEIHWRSVSSTLEELPLGITETRISGELELHGVRQDITVPIILDYRGDRLQVSGSFELLLSDYDMRAPSVLGRTVADRIAVDFEINAQKE